jgi:uncharacterized protein YejL (UPF0352 family)
MDYDFSTLCADQIEKLQKKLISINKSFMYEYKLSLNVINNRIANDHRGEIANEVEDLLSDQVTKCCVQYMETLRKVQSALARHL